MTKPKKQGALALVYRSVDDLVPDPQNARRHPPEQIAQILKSIKAYGFTKPVLLKGDGKTIGAGNGAWEAAKQGGLKEIPTVTLKGLTDDQWRAYALLDNRVAANSEWNMDVLVDQLKSLNVAGFELTDLGFGKLELGEMGISGFAAEPAPPKVKLSDKFGIAPFSVLNAREGWWQNRKAAWLALGIKSEVGRGENLLKMSDTVLQPDPEKRAAMKGKARTFGQDLMKGEHVVGKGKAKGDIKGGLVQHAHIHKYDGQDGGAASGAGTSIFDPVLCELAYRWFCPPGGQIIDPFAGGSVRGIVAAKLGRAYLGVDLRPEQVEANEAQAADIIEKKARKGALGPRWIAGDSRNIGKLVKDTRADFIFSCPPYADLEVYSDDPKDLSTLDYPAFRKAYFDILSQAVALLKPDRFACFVVGDVRGKDGNYYGFVPDTIAAFEKAGARFYNEAILVTAVGSLPIRINKQFEGARKLGKTHQNVLVFLKGDAKKATKAIGAVEFGSIEEGSASAPAPAPAAAKPQKKASPAKGGEFGEEL